MPADLAIARALEDAERLVASLRAALEASVRATPPQAPLSLQQAAGRLAVHEETMRRYAERFALGRKVGGKWRFTVSELEAFATDRNLLG